MLRTTLVTFGLVATTALATAKPIRLSKTSAPLALPELTAQIDTNRRNDTLGYQDCGDGFTTVAPSLTWEVTETLPTYRLRITDATGLYHATADGIIVFPDGHHECTDNHDELYLKDWPKGSYQLFLTGSSTSVMAAVHFEDPTRSKAAVDRALAALPKLASGGDGANPSVHALGAPPSAEAGDVGVGHGCVGDQARIIPLASLEVKASTQFLFDLPGVELFAVFPNGGCAEVKDETSLAAGAYTLWGKLPAGGMPKPLSLTVDDWSRPLAFGDAPKHAVGALDQPLVLPGKVRPAPSVTGNWRSRTCKLAAREPDLYLTSDQPLQQVELSLLWSRKPQVLHLYGPLEKMASNDRPSCGELDQSSLRKLPIFEGTYAVWVGGEAADDGSDYHVLVRRADAKIDPLTSLAPIPTDLTLAERAIHNHYPFFSDHSAAAWNALFTQAPDQLFVYARADHTDSGDVHVTKGEPLMVDWSNPGSSAALTYDGHSLLIPTELLTAERPGQIWLPSKPALPEVTSVSGAIDAAGPEDAKAIAAYQKLDDKYTVCLGNYLEKHDPTWGKGEDVYKISRGGTVTNVSDEVGAAGARKCGGKKLEGAGKQLMKSLARTRTGRYTGWLAAVRKRFGL